jgi:hypothetical protein
MLSTEQPSATTSSHCDSLELDLLLQKVNELMEEAQLALSNETSNVTSISAEDRIQPAPKEMLPFKTSLDLTKSSICRIAYFLLSPAKYLIILMVSLGLGPILFLYHVLRRKGRKIE